MNKFTKTLAAILANTALVWGGCVEQPDDDGLVTLPAFWTSVPAAAFRQCYSLKKVVIPKGVKEILDAAFDSSGLEFIEFEAGSQLTSIGGRSFYSTSKLKEIVIPQGVKEIGSGNYGAFEKSALEFIEFEAGSQLTSIGERAFRSTPLKSIKIPQGVKEILSYAFRTSGLEDIEFDAGSELASIGLQAFFECAELKKLVIPPGVKEILYAAFWRSGLAIVEFEDNSQLETIGPYAFADTKLRTINIPQGVAPFDPTNNFAGTPCTNLSVFMPGNTVVNCQVITSTPSPTSMPTTAAPTTKAPTTSAPTTMVPTTAAPTTAAPTTSAPTTMAPTTAVPTTMVPTTAGPTTAAPTTSAPTLMAPTTAAPSTAAPTTMSPTEVKDACVNLNKRKCRNTCVFSKRQRQCLPKSTSFVHDCAQYEGKTPCLENKVCKFPHGKCVHRCDGKNARRCRKHQFCNLDKVVNPCFGCHLVTACGPHR